MAAVSCYVRGVGATFVMSASDKCEVRGDSGLVLLFSRARECVRRYEVRRYEARRYEARGGCVRCCRVGPW